MERLPPPRAVASAPAARVLPARRLGVRHGAVLLCALLAGVAAIAAMGAGPAMISPGDVLAILFEWLLGPAEGVSEADRAVVLAIRLPRAVTGLLVGGGLALAGAALQGIFRNPLAEPGLIGVSSGAALGAVTVIVIGGGVGAALGGGLGAYLLPLAAFVGGLIATVLAFKIGAQGGRVMTATLLLAGIAIAAVCNAGVGLMIFAADDEQLRSLNFWMLGSLAGSTWSLLLPALPFLVVPILLLPLLAGGLNLLALGEAEAGHLGLEVERFKRAAIALVALVTGAAVAVSGTIAFVGLVVPHLLRLAIGPDHRTLLPASAFLGGALLLGADIAARLVVAPAELPIGILTTLIGGPFFIWLLLRHRSRTAL